jgi:hypothetical protein
MDILCSQPGDHYSIQISKTPPFGASDDYLWKNSWKITEKNISKTPSPHNNK